MSRDGVTPAQTFSHWPAIPPGIKVRLTLLAQNPCPYLPGRLSQSRAFLAHQMPAVVYQRLMDANFRRSGQLVYQPACSGCRECQQIRVPVETFKPSKSQRRCWKKNADLRVEQGPPLATDETFELYQRYQREWHHRTDEAATDARAGFEQFLYQSPVPSVEFQYRDQSGRLLAVGICDLTPDALSSVYFYFDPADRSRGLGTFGALYELDYARQQQLPFYYLGFWVADCRAMRYKRNFRPCQLLRADGRWVEVGVGNSDADYAREL